jgi:hypothetical protein
MDVQTRAGGALVLGAGGRLLENVRDRRFKPAWYLPAGMTHVRYGVVG